MHFSVLLASELIITLQILSFSGDNATKKLLIHLNKLFEAVNRVWCFCSSLHEHHSNHSPPQPREDGDTDDSDNVAAPDNEDGELDKSGVDEEDGDTEEEEEESTTAVRTTLEKVRSLFPMINACVEC
jgi:hypothetical protein